MSASDKFGLFMFGITTIGIGIFAGFLMEDWSLASIIILVGVIALYFLKRG
jgi:hypothetical protein